MSEQNKPDYFEFISEKCDLCGTCIAICPQNVINIVRNTIFIDYENCIRCLFCVYICPVRAIKAVYSSAETNKYSV